MENRFKFRGYIEELSTWIYGSPISNDMMYLHGDEYHVSIILQYTTFKDKNNKEIYEGDILQYGDNDMYNQMGVVKFIKGKFIVCGPFGIYNISDRWIKNPVILGNIIEHKVISDALFSITDKEFENIALYI